MNKDQLIGEEIAFQFDLISSIMWFLLMVLDNSTWFNFNHNFKLQDAVKCQCLTWIESHLKLIDWSTFSQSLSKKKLSLPTSKIFNFNFRHQQFPVISPAIQTRPLTCALTSLAHCSAFKLGMEHGSHKNWAYQRFLFWLLLRAAFLPHSLASLSHRW